MIELNLENKKGKIKINSSDVKNILIDESYFDVLFEDVRAYLKDATDEIEEEIQDKYLLDNVRCYFEVYNIDETFTDFKFVFLVSFKDINNKRVLDFREPVY